MMKVLLAGETFACVTTVAVGSQALSHASWSTGATAFLAAARSGGVSVTHIGGDRCPEEFPLTASKLAQYDVVILSDIGALSLLVGPDTRRGRTGANRLTLIREFVEGGGGLLCAGGYMSFQGMFGSAGFHDTAIEDVLPVDCLDGPDGLEVPEGLLATIMAPDHPIWSGIAGPLPAVLGLNRVRLKREREGQLLAFCEYRGKQWPLLAVREFARGRTAAWTTDIGPHWLSEDFINWSGYERLINNLLHWLAPESAA
jgi:uncharacterized membrane protein